MRAMSDVRVKICGIKNIDDARAAAELGADELGFHVGLEGGRSPLTKEMAGTIIKELPPHVSAVVVTSVTDPKELIDIAQHTGARTLQLYGDATPEQIKEVKVALPGLKIWKVINISDEASIDLAKTYEASADAVALDTLNKKTGARGGSGKTHDWDISQRVVKAVSIPVILAGGLDPGNVARGVAQVAPTGVDVNSGVTNPDGSKDLEKVKLFIERAKGM